MRTGRLVSAVVGCRPLLIAVAFRSGLRKWRKSWRLYIRARRLLAVTKMNRWPPAYRDPFCYALLILIGIVVTIVVVYNVRAGCELADLDPIAEENSTAALKRLDKVVEVLRFQDSQGTSLLRQLADAITADRRSNDTVRHRIFLLKKHVENMYC